MTKPAISQSQKRFNESVGALFVVPAGQNPSCIFLKSSTDVGVIRNGGRNGARFAPQSFLASFKKFSQSNDVKENIFQEFEVSSESEEFADFKLSQQSESLRIAELIKKYPKARVCHLGGGHDHVYPLLRAQSHLYEKIVVINIDAHADTRTDSEFHSGTPFRQFANEYGGEFHLFQIGLHPFANSFSTLSPLEKGHEDILWMKDFSEENLAVFFQKIKKILTDKTLVLFSIDADALSGDIVPGVSAVNPAGLSRQQLLASWKAYQELGFKHPPMMGIYELNPLYDTLASISMRTMASFVFETF